MRLPLIGMGAAMAVLANVAPASALITLGNGVYEVHIQDSSGPFPSQFGSWNAVTGAAFPAVGAGKDILYNDTTVSQNFSSLRVFNPFGAPTDYTFGGAASGIDLDTYYVAASEGTSPFGSDGFRQVWDVTSEGLTITQDVVITGTSLADSAIYHTVEIHNYGADPVAVGWRNEYDWNLTDPGFDDGPNNAVEQAGGSVVLPAQAVEFSYLPVVNDYVRVSVAPGTPSYQVLLSLGFDPGLIPALPVTVPDEYAFVSLAGAFGAPYDYTLTGSVDITTGSGADSAGLSWFGRDLASAAVIDAGASLRVTQILFAVLPDGLPPNDPPEGPTTGPSVPEPATLALFGFGLLGMAVIRRRRAG